MANKTISLEDGSVCELMGDPSKSIKQGGCKLGEGGQGTVYRVKNLQTGKIMALKVYKDVMSREFVNNLRNNIVKGAPDDSFLWPRGLIKPIGKDKNKYGYVMDLYDAKSYTSFPKIVKGQVNFPTKEMQIATLIDLVDSFDTLHKNGYSYQDLNDGGVLYDVQRGKVLICDNDNVAPFDVNLGILGKYKFMAPEVAIGLFKPDKHSDRFSLAVLMFYMLLHAHPYDGVKRLDGAFTPEKQAKVYGTEAVFIFHPTDTSNRPDPEIDKNAILAWEFIPDHIKELFVKTFTSGMPAVGMKRDKIEVDRQARVSEKQWREALLQWMDSLAECPNCKNSLYVSVENRKIKPQKCPHCKKKVQVARPILEIRKNGKPVRTILIEADKIVAKSSITKERTNDPGFIVERGKKNPNLFGIRNKLDYQWRCSRTGEKDYLVDPEKVAPALPGVSIEFDYTFSGEFFNE